MKQQDAFFKTVCKIAAPVTLQSMLQSSFSVVDQVMIGQLGSVSIAGIGLAGKFSSIYSVLLSAVAAAAGIMIAQYMGKEEEREVSRSFFMNLALAVGIAILFTILCITFPQKIIRLYIEDAPTIAEASAYLRILAVSYLPMAGAALLSTMLRCMERAELALYASLAGALLNTGLNYILIFGKMGISPMGVRGAALATLFSQIVYFVLILWMFIRSFGRQEKRWMGCFAIKKAGFLQYGKILLPILVCELLWSLGENVYAIIYGHLGSSACAAMTLTNPIQSLMIGALSGLSQAAGIIIGKNLGKREYDRAYQEARKLLAYGAVGSVLLSLLLLGISRYYVEIYAVEDSVKLLTRQILFAYVFIAPVKVQNMILGGGIIRSGGKTEYVMWIDFIGTWFFGVPLGILSAFVLGLSIPYVYFILSLEECVRFAISLIVFQRKMWMHSLKAQE